MPGKKNGASSNASVKTALSCFIPVPAPWFAIHGLWRIGRIPSSHLAMSAGRKKILSAGFARPIMASRLTRAKDGLPHPRRAE
jgi:hypothetical protein